ncbi:hypothetical protein FOMG_18252 [Fusarium oxysporum f. sp. melonis 26406]|uniref:Uncharacterized protein n=1 Tax=Fusarium oxysporum f. sp. melonis 26406 TaxID=1089452 RepID=W9YZW1_FUSOX|nr:hypothetical protein FOMG_18252 [Fusarium oxysporum f. sp. melonis 26406]
MGADSFWLHKELFRVYMPAWRRYNAYLEETLLPIANNAVVTFIEELTDTERRQLTQLAFLETKLIQTPVILQATQDVLGELSSLFDEQFWVVHTVKGTSDHPVSCQFKQYHRNCQAYARVAQSLQERTQRITQLLVNTLSFREQLNAKSQNENMLKLNKSAVFITTLTLLYLPPSFVATFFGMNFFELDKEKDQIVSTSMIWVFALCSALLTAGTFLLYHLLLDGTLLGQLGDIILNLRKITLRRTMPKDSDHELELV